MEGLDFLMENLRPLSPLLGYAIVRVSEVATSCWTWTGLVLIVFLSLWRFRGIKGFQIRFSWWGKQADLRVMLQSSFSCKSNHAAARKNSTAFADDNRSVCRNMCVDDFHVFTYRGGGLAERGISTRRSKNRGKSSSIIDSLTLCDSVEGMDNCIESPSACFLQTKMLFIIEKSSSFSASKSVPSALRSGERELESPTSDQNLDCLVGCLSRLSKHEKLCLADEIEVNKCRSIEEAMQDCRGKIAFASDFLYEVEYEEKCKGSLFVMNDGEGEGRLLGPCLSDNCVDLGLWRRLVSFEIQFGWDRLQSLRLGYDWNWNWNCCTGGSGLNFDKFSKYLVRDINVANVSESPKRSVVKLFYLQEDAVSSVDILWNMGLSATSTIDSTVRLWDIEVGKCLNKMMLNDSEIVGTHIENSPGFLLSGMMIREENPSLFMWDPRDFLKPLSFSMGSMSTFHSVQFNDNKVCVSDCFNDGLFDLRMTAVSSPVEVRHAKLSSSTLPTENTSLGICHLHQS